ncbi:L,D-transpeptidase [Bradyrhizobium sp.]|uniref:L,D-transpeptidase n=1 Tax=Bradyrhizobium sp. TaxID=376 RepID=UPI0039E4FAE1
MNVAKRGPLLAATMLAAATLGGCVTDTGMMPTAMASSYTRSTDARYAAVSDSGFTVPAVPSGDLKQQYMRQLVDDPTGEPPGTVVVDPKNRFLYLVQEGGKALRYGVGVGKAGAAWSGTADVAMKREWPYWTPTPAMIAREPGKYKRWQKGMDGGASNPLGARALYLFRNGRDTLYRIHGTNEPWSIGQAMSSGCIRMMNQDVIDLYRRVPKGAKVVVLPAGDGEGPTETTR